MRITIESTSEVTILARDDLDRGVPARVWQGVTESGIRVQCLIARIAVHKDDDPSQFEAELIEQRPPVDGTRAFPLRMIL